MEQKKILIVDDDASIRDIIRIYVRNAGFAALEAENGEDAMKLVAEKQPDLIVLDLMMPKMDGVTFCLKLREHSMVPVLMLSARTEDMDKIHGLSIGADDYVTKPFNPLELMARIKALLRRSLVSLSADVTLAARENQEKEEGIIAVRDLIINTVLHRVTISGREVKLTPKEFAILTLLASHPRQVFSLEHIYDAVWQEPVLESDATVMVHIRNIREKIEEDPRHPSYLKNVWGVGYKIE